MAGGHFSQRNPLSLPEGYEISLGDTNICSSHAVQLLAFALGLLSPRLTIAQESTLLPTTQGCEHLLATLQQSSVHTVGDSKTEWLWNISFPFFLCFPSGILILSARNRVSLLVCLDNSHAENLQEKGTDFLHKLLVRQLNGWLLPLQKIY